MKKDKRPTFMSQVEETLRIIDDFVTLHDVMELCKIDSRHASACLLCLKKYKAVETVEVEGKVFWLYTPQSDTRLYSVPEMAPEDKPRRARRSKKVIPLPDPTGAVQLPTEHVAAMNRLFDETLEAAKPRGKA